jgi:hypothetical protein
MAKKIEKTFIGTHERVILSDCASLSALIEKHGRRIKAQRETAQDSENSAQNPHIISQQEIEDAINGPLQGFFKQIMSAHAKLSLIRMNLTILDDESFNKNRAQLTSDDQVPTNILQSISLSDIHKIQQELDQLTETQNQQWEKFHSDWAEYLNHRINEIGVSLSEIESSEFNTPEPSSELQERFIALNIALPKVKLDDMNFLKYFTLKSDIAIHSALSRQHLPNNQTDINKFLKKLKTDFDTMHKQESDLLAAHKSVTNQAVAKISW